VVAALGAAVVVGAAGSSLGAIARERRSIETGSRDAALPSPERALEPAPSGLRVEGVPPLLTPNEDFYRIDTNITVPRISAEGWTLRVHGLVARELELTLDELSDLGLVEADITMACVSAEVGGDLVGTARWLGVPLPRLLGMAGVEPGGEQVVGRAEDGWTAGFPLEAALDGRDALVAVGMNGEPLPAAHGFPARLVVPGLYGYVSATKWLAEIELAPSDFDAYWVPRGWAKEAPIHRQSRIDRPADGAELPGSEVVAAGVAWAPLVGVDAVELQVDDGGWQPAELGPALSDAAWRQWVWRGELEPGEHHLRVRCVGGDGKRQTGEVSPPRPDGATGWHTITVAVA
jgi:DMSO/TMAO reductase YedYZ molybdopterin-dependent catalytic subunit